MIACGQTVATIACQVLPGFAIARWRGKAMTWQGRSSLQLFTFHGIQLKARTVNRSGYLMTASPASYACKRLAAQLASENRGG